MQAETSYTPEEALEALRFQTRPTFATDGRWITAYNTVKRDLALLPEARALIQEARHALWGLEGDSILYAKLKDLERRLPFAPSTYRPEGK